MNENDFTSRLAAIRSRIRAACERAGRDPASVELVAVSKGHPPDAVREAADLGLTVFGESRIQEAGLKISACPGHLRWHLIGHLQTNKCREAVRFFQMIQSVDSLKVATEIDKWAGRFSKSMPVLLEVNIAGEASKHGLDPRELPGLLDEFNALPHLEIHGLMTIAPYGVDPEKARPCFLRMRDLRGACEDVLGAPLTQLSMGMSHDFEVAIEAGATMIRVGTDLFGTRSKPAK